MNGFPPASAVAALERRLEQSARQLRQHLDQARSTLNSSITRSSRLLLVVSGIGAVVGMWWARRKLATVAAAAGIASPVLNIGLVLLARVATRYLAKQPDKGE